MINIVKNFTVTFAQSFKVFMENIKNFSRRIYSHSFRISDFVLVYETKTSSAEKDGEKKRKQGREKFFSELQRQGLQLEEVSYPATQIHLFPLFLLPSISPPLSILNTVLFSDPFKVLLTTRKRSTD